MPEAVCLLAHHSSVLAKAFHYLFKSQTDIKLQLSSRTGALPSSHFCGSSRAVPSFVQDRSGSGQQEGQLWLSIAQARALLKRSKVCRLSGRNQKTLSAHCLSGKLRNAGQTCSKILHFLLEAWTHWSLSSSFLNDNGKGTNVNSLSQRLPVFINASFPPEKQRIPTGPLKLRRVV